jgi:hypothetical protein
MRPEGQVTPSVLAGGMVATARNDRGVSEGAFASFSFWGSALLSVVFNPGLICPKVCEDPGCSASCIKSRSTGPQPNKRYM